MTLKDVHVKTDSDYYLSVFKTYYWSITL